MKKAAYKTPTVLEYGRIDEVTLGANGPSADAVYDISSGTLAINNNAPSCWNNVPSGYCYTFVP